MTPIKKEKDAIRKACAERRNQMTSEEHKSFDEKIIQTAGSLVSFRHADIILLYAPIKSEIDVMPIFDIAKQKGKRVAFPKCNTEERTMKFHFVDSLEELSPCAYGIREPSENAPVYDPETTQGSALCFVPGLAFDVYVSLFLTSALPWSKCCFSLPSCVQPPSLLSDSSWLFRL